MASRPAPLRLGIIGCGFVTRHRHLPALRRIAAIRVVALADPDPAPRAEAARQAAGARQHADGESLLGDPAVEAVAVCVPVVGHAALAAAALEAGKHVFVEKPLALRLEDADRLVALAAATPARLMVGFNLRFHRHLQAARRLVAAGQLGRIQALTTVFSDRGGGGRTLPAWRGRRDAGGGVLLDKLAHHFDLWRFLLDDEIEEVFALSVAGRGDDDTVSVMARTRRGTAITTLGLDDSVMRHEVVLYGDRGGLHVDCYRVDGFTRLGPDDVPGAPATRLRRLRPGLGNLRAALAAIRRGGDFNATYAAEWRHFAAAARTGQPPAGGAAEGRAALAIALAADRARSLGEPVRIAGPATTGAPA